MTSGKQLIECHYKCTIHLPHMLYQMGGIRPCTGSAKVTRRPASVQKGINLRLSQRRAMPCRLTRPTEQFWR